MLRARPSRPRAGGRPALRCTPAGPGSCSRWRNGCPAGSLPSTDARSTRAAARRKHDRAMKNVEHQHAPRRFSSPSLRGLRTLHARATSRQMGDEEHQPCRDFAAGSQRARKAVASPAGARYFRVFEASEGGKLQTRARAISLRPRVGSARRHGRGGSAGRPSLRCPRRPATVAGHVDSPGRRAASSGSAPAREAWAATTGAAGRSSTPPPAFPGPRCGLCARRGRHALRGNLGRGRAPRAPMASIPSGREASRCGAAWPRSSPGRRAPSSWERPWASSSGRQTIDRSREFHGEGPLAGAEVTALTRDGAGTEWVGTSRGLARPAPDRALGPGARPGPASPGGSWRFSPAPAGRFSCRSRTRVSSRALRAPSAGSVTTARRAAACWPSTAERDDPDVLWLGTDRKGAFSRHGDRFEPFSTAEGLSGNRVKAIFEDREGVLWFGTDSALTKRGASSFLRFDVADGFSIDQPVFGMAESRDGALWFSAWDSGVVRLLAERRLAAVHRGRRSPRPARGGRGGLSAGRSGRGDEARPRAHRGRHGATVPPASRGLPGHPHSPDRARRDHPPGDPRRGSRDPPPRRSRGAGGGPGRRRHHGPSRDPRRNDLGGRRGRRRLGLPAGSPRRRAADHGERPALEPGHVDPLRLAGHALGDDRPRGLAARS